MDWDKLRVFHAVAEAGSFTHAGDTLNLSQSAVSRQISALEDHLKITLFHRHARGLILTEQGELLMRTAKEVFAKLAMTEAQLSESKERPQGPLKLTTTVAFGSTWLTPRLRKFLELYPDIQATLVLDDSELDLAMREADVGIRFMAPRQPELVQRHLFSLRHIIMASPEYLEKYGTPRSAADLEHHRLITYGDETKAPITNVNWLADIAGRPRGAPLFEVNNIYAIFRATQAGIGIAALPDYLVREDNNLVQILPEIAGPTFEAFFVYPDELRHSKRIMVFRDFLIEEVALAAMSGPRNY